MVDIDGSGRNRELSIQEERDMEMQATLKRMDEIHDIISESYEKLSDVIYEIRDFDDYLGRKLDDLVDELANYYIAFGNKVYNSEEENERGWEEC